MRWRSTWNQMTQTMNLISPVGERMVVGGVSGGESWDSYDDFLDAGGYFIGAGSGIGGKDFDTGAPSQVAQPVIVFPTVPVSGNPALTAQFPNSPVDMAGNPEPGVLDPPKRADAPAPPEEPFQIFGFTPPAQGVFTNVFGSLLPGNQEGVHDFIPFTDRSGAFDPIPGGGTFSEPLAGVFGEGFDPMILMLLVMSNDR